MSWLGDIALGIGALLALYAIYAQRRDIVPGVGGTMGGEMTVGLTWLLAACFAALGSAAYLPWYLSALTGVGVLALSFLIRLALARIPKPPGR